MRVEVVPLTRDEALAHWHRFEAKLAENDRLLAEVNARRHEIAVAEGWLMNSPPRRPQRPLEVAEMALVHRGMARQVMGRDPEVRKDRALGRSLRRMRKRGIYTGPKE